MQSPCWFELTGWPFATGLIPVFASLPGILIGPVAGVLVDRWDRKRVMAGSALALVGLLIVTSAFADRLGVGALYTIIFVQSMVMTFFAPAENALARRRRRRRRIYITHVET
jgi:MFS family permease